LQAPQGALGAGSASPVPVQPPPVQSVELTAKKWKAAMLISALMMVVGLPLAIFCGQAGGSAGVAIGVLLAAAGLIGWLIARIGAWWFHG